MGSSNKRGKQPQNKYPVIMIIIGTIMIISGTYLSYLNTPQKLFCSVLNKIIYVIENKQTNEKITGISDNYTLDSNIIINAESKLIENPTSQEHVSLKKMLVNLNQITTSIKFTQDKTTEKMFFNINSHLNNQELINAKYLVENSTEYYFVNDIIPNYINNGNSNYFEALTENTTSKENIIYILKTISNSLDKNLKNNYFLKTKEKIDINGKIKELNKISLELNSTTTKEITKNILKDLKEEQQANRIITGLDKDFFKNNTNDQILSTNEKIIINFYTTLLGKIEKYEIIVKDGTNESQLTYEPSTQQSYIIENNQVLYRIEYKLTDNKKTLIFFDDNKNEQGKIIYEDQLDRNILSINLKQKENMIDVIYDSRLKNIVKNSSYENEIDFILKMSSQDSNILNLTFDINNKITNDLAINEDTTTAIFASSVTEDQKELLNKKIDNIFTRLTN